MSRNSSGRFREITDRLFDDGVVALPSESDGLTKEELEMKIQSAKQEWINAQEYFNEAIEPELVDHAILTLQAAERKYMYWLQQIKDWG